MPGTVAISILTRAPVPGETKQRLIPAVGAERAAAIHELMLERVVSTAVAANIGPVTLACTPTTEHACFEQLFGRHGVNLQPQCDGDLGQRMFHELDQGLDQHAGALVLGADCPGVEVSDLHYAREWLLEGMDAVLGPSTDGGYYLLAVSRVLPQLFDGIHWGEPSVAEETRQRMQRLDFRWCELPERVDVDTGEDLSAYAFLEAWPGVPAGR